MDNNTEQTITNDEQQTTDIETNVNVVDENGKQVDKSQQLSDETVEEVDEQADYSRNVKKRIDKLSAKLSAKDQEIQRLQSLLESSASNSANQQNAPKQQVMQVKEPPKLSDYENFDDFTNAMTDFKLETKLREIEVGKRQQAVIQSYNSKVEEFQKEAPDFVVAVGEIQGIISQDGALLEAIIESDIGPQLAYHLANHDDALNKLMSLSPAKRLIELGKLELRLSSNKQKQLGNKDSSVISESKQPISRVTTKSGASKTVDRNAPPSDYNEWVKWRKATK